MSYFIWGVGLAAIIYVSLDPPFWPLSQFLSLSIWYPIAQLAYSGGVLNIMICSMYSEYLQAVYPLASWNQSVNYFALAFIFLQVAAVSLAAGDFFWLNHAYLLPYLTMHICLIYHIHPLHAAPPNPISFLFSYRRIYPHIPHIS